MSEPSARTTSETTAGNYFVANYPPFSFWSGAEVERALARLSGPPPDAPLGIYVHLPFCRKRCDFCYFKVYTDKNAREIGRYLDAVLAEAERLATQPYLAGRRPLFVYFGGGTPSYLSTKQLRFLFEGLQRAFPWEGTREVAFECEPGTILVEKKLELLRELGVTRLSLGIENFDPQILELNNRAHRATEIYRAFENAREVGFPQINLDLIAGMVGESDENWSRCVEECARLAPESVTVYQMEVPYNTTIYRRMKDGGREAAPVADWPTKRRWAGEAFARLEAAGYHLGSAYTAVKDPGERFLYRDALWTGADMLGIGVSSFGHLGGVHVQNESRFEDYLRRVEGGELPLQRALELSEEERLVREFVLQMKLGRLPTEPFRRRYGVDVRARFAEPLERHRDAGWLELAPEEIRTTRDGLLRIDTLLHDYFLERHQGARYA